MPWVMSWHSHGVWVQVQYNLSPSSSACTCSEGEKGTVWHKNLVYSSTEDEHSPLMEKSRNLNVVWLFANQSLPEGSSIGLICKEGAQVPAGWQGLGPQVQGAQNHSIQKEEESRSSDVNQGQPTASSVIARKSDAKPGHQLSKARYESPWYTYKQLRQGPELVFSSPAEGQRPWQSFLLPSPSLSVFSANSMLHNCAMLELTLSPSNYTPGRVCVEAERLQSLLVHLGLTDFLIFQSACLYFTVFAMTLLWNQFEVILCCLEQSQFCIVHPGSTTINFCGSSAWRKAEILITYNMKCVAVASKCISLLWL